MGPIYSKLYHQYSELRKSCEDSINKLVNPYGNYFVNNANGQGIFISTYDPNYGSLTGYVVNIHYPVDESHGLILDNCHGNHGFLTRRVEIGTSSLSLKYLLAIVQEVEFEIQENKTSTIKYEYEDDSVVQGIEECVEEVLGIDHDDWIREMNEDIPKMSNLGADSLDICEIAMKLELKFNILIKDNLEDYDNIDDIIRYVKGLVANKN